MRSSDKFLSRHSKLLHFNNEQHADEEILFQLFVFFLTKFTRKYRSILQEVLIKQIMKKKKQQNFSSIMKLISKIKKPQHLFHKTFSFIIFYGGKS